MTTTGDLRSVHRNATCRDCDRTWSDPYASANAARHAAAWGHTVDGLVLVERLYLPAPRSERNAP